MTAARDDGAGAVLVVDDEPLNLELLCQELEVAGYRIEAARDGAEALRVCAARPPDVVLLDIMMPGMDGIEVCRRLKATAETRDVPVIFMTALSGIESKVASFEAGGIDYVTKPFQIEEVLARVGTHVALRRAHRALAEQNRRLSAEIEAHRRAQRTIECLREEIETELRLDGIIGEAPALKAALANLGKVAATDATVLIDGETGTGKELFARALHARSPRSAGPLIKLNCATLPKELIESELFGHEEGAFTGAIRSRKGRFELADKGTLFLDEVGELSAEAQAKLLRVLQERELERVGGSRSVAVDVRVVAATNKDLAEAVRRGSFRDDLYYRLNVFPISVPPLRDRPGDVGILARHFTEATGRRLGKRFTGLAPGVPEMLERYDWPGNVRELQNVIERSAILSSGPLLEVFGALESAQPATPASGTLRDAERAHIARALAEAGGLIEGPEGAACRLGLNPSTLRGKMRKLGLAREQ